MSNEELRRKAEKGLECCILQAENDVCCREIECPYYDPDDSANLLCWTKLNRDAIRVIESSAHVMPVHKEVNRNEMP